MKTLTLAALLFFSSVVNADLICAQCEYDTGAEGSYLGSFDPATRDRATFQHLTFEQGRFRDAWVFDVGPEGARVDLVMAALGIVDACSPGNSSRTTGRVCPAFACTSVVTGALIDASASLDGAFTIFERLDPGRYVLRVTGVVAPPRDNIYRGFLDLTPLTVREAGTLGLFGLGLFALAAAIRRHQR